MRVYNLRFTTTDRHIWTASARTTRTSAFTRATGSASSSPHSSSHPKVGNRTVHYPLSDPSHSHWPASRWHLFSAKIIVWEDQAVWNVDFIDMFPLTTPHDLGLFFVYLFIVIFSVWFFCLSSVARFVIVCDSLVLSRARFLPRSSTIS